MTPSAIVTASNGPYEAAYEPPRYEFRAFAPNFGLVERHIRADAELDKLEESRQIYLVSASGGSERNVKIRDDAVELKILDRREGELELWRPALRIEFPLSADDLRNTVLEPLELRASVPTDSRLSITSLLTDVVFQTAGLVAAVVDKRRAQFQRGPHGSILAEHTRVRVNGAGVETVAVESPNPELLSASLPMLGLDAYRNVSYVAAIKVITGLTSFLGRGSALGVEDIWEQSLWETT